MAAARRLARRHGRSLQALNELGPLNLSYVLPHLKTGLLQAIDNCAHNCLGNSGVLPPPVQARLRKQLRPYKAQLGPLLRSEERRGTAHQRTAYLRQRGQAAGAIASAVLSAAVPLLIDLITKKKSK